VSTKQHISSDTGSKMVRDDDSNEEMPPQQWRTTIVSILQGESKNTSEAGDIDGNVGEQVIKVKKLRKLVLLSLQQDESDKSAKKSFKRTIQELEKDGTINLDEEGHIALKKNKRKHKEDKKTKKKKKVRDDENTKAPHLEGSEQAQIPQNNELSSNINDSNKEPCSGNPQGVTRLFLGNLPFAVDETSLEAFIPGMTHVKWITDKETGKFYGSAFVEMGTSMQAAAAVAKAGESLLGRPIKINVAPALPGDKWPPEKKVVSGGSTTGNTNGLEKNGLKAAGGSGIKAMSVKPENCVKLFIGNLSYEIDDDAITKFFGSVDSEVKAVRWIHHKDTGDFKGV
jgi:nucleolin